MKLERTNNSIRNIIYGVINKLITLLLPFITRTIIIWYLGAEYLGLSSLFASILQVLSLAELGFSTAMVYHMYGAVASDNKEELGALLKYYRKIYHNIGLVILLCGLILIPFLDKLITGNYPESINIYILYLLYLTDTVLSYFLYAYKSSLLQAYQRSDIISNVGSLMSCIKVVLQIIVLLIFRNYYLYTILLLVYTIATNIIISYKVDFLFPDICTTGEITLEQRYDIKNRVFGLMCHKVGSIVVNSLDSIIISSFLGLVALAKYQNYFYIMNTVAGVLGIIYTSMTAAVGNSLKTEKLEKNYQDFRKFSFINFWLICVCSSCLLCLYQHFMNIWVGTDLMYDFTTVILFVLYFYIYQSRKIVITYKDAAGLWTQDRIRPFIESVLNLALNIILINIIGIKGVLISTIVSMFFVNVYWESSIVFKNVFKKKVFDYIQEYIKYSISIVVIVVITYLICLVLPISGILWLIVKLIVCIIVTNLLFLIAYWKNPLQKEFFEFTRLVLNRVIKKCK